VVTRIVANVPTPEFQKFSSKLIESLKRENENITQQDPDTDALMERVRGIFTAIAGLA
jgi:hypothetical protein